ncbi:MAG: GNAT family N-acetyltransferase [Bacteroidetes bacterium]|nr:GNAT family N-acetyltransferase [Bacteroidota bacterium]
MQYCESTRLVLRQLQEKDLDDFLTYRSNPHVMKYQGFEVFNSTEALAFIREQMSRTNCPDEIWTQMGISLKTESKLIGDCAIRISPNGTAEFGITVSPAYQSKGFAKEALLTLLAYAKSTRSIRSAIGIVDERNRASIQLLTSLAFHLDKICHRVPFKGSTCTEFHYRLTL